MKVLKINGEKFENKQASEYIMSLNVKKGQVVVMDLDETVLDNSDYQVDLFNKDDSIKGVATNDMGLDINNEKKDSFELKILSFEIINNLFFCYLIS